MSTPRRSAPRSMGIPMISICISMFSKMIVHIQGNHVASLILRIIKSVICRMQDGFAIGTMVRVTRHTGGKGYIKMPPVEIEWLFSIPPPPEFGALVCVFMGGIRHQDHEFLAAVATDDVSLARI